MLNIVLTVCITAVIITALIIYHLNRCKHVWEKKETISVYEGYRKDDPNCIPSYKKFIMQCKKCGAIKIYKSN